MICILILSCKKESDLRRNILGSLRNNIFILRKQKYYIVLLSKRYHCTLAGKLLLCPGDWFPSASWSRLLLIVVTISISDECKMWSVGAADNQVLTQVACDTLLRKTQSKYQLTNNVHFVYL